jgi:hypothetical protein
MRVSFVAVYWTWAQVVMGSNPGRVKIVLFHAAATSLPPQKSVRPPYGHYRL